MYYRSNETDFCAILQRLPDAVAVVNGDAQNSRIQGTVKFYQAVRGVLIVADIFGLPASAEACKTNIFAFHIHGGLSCSGNEEDPFADAGTHYNPDECPHPYHAGDMPPLFGAGDRAFLAFLTDRLTVNEVIGKAVILHDRPDDFTTQPSGNAGNKIACGIILKVRR
jgi:Cu-Zn family superoxide dismutase